MFENRNRFYAFLLVACIFVIGGMCVVSWMKTPTLYPGDRVETRTCRDCNGTGKDPDPQSAVMTNGKCPACGGTGKVQVIIPGDQHPTVIKGRVLSAEDNTQPSSSYEQPSTNSTNPVRYSQFPELKAGIAGAKLNIEGPDGSKTELEANDIGDFRTQLRPGNYKVTAEADGYRKTVGEFVVNKLTDPIWVEQAHIVREEDAGSQSVNGLTVLVGLSKGNTDGCVNTFEGMP